MLGIGATALSTTSYFDMGKNLWRVAPVIPAYSLVVLTENGWTLLDTTMQLLPVAAPMGIAMCEIKERIFDVYHPAIFRGPGEIQVRALM